MLGKWLMKSEDGHTLLRVKVVPNSEKFEVKDVNRWMKRLKIRLESSPSKGKANGELVERMEEHTGRGVKIRSGRRSRKKTLLVKNIGPGELGEKLGIGGRSA